MLRLLAAGLMLSLGSGAQAQDGAECFSKYTKTNVCAYAREAQAKFSSILPMQMSQTVTVVSAAAMGPMLMITARWEMSKADLDRRLVANGVSPAQLGESMLALATNNACGSPQLAAFVRLGGKIRWAYNTADHFPITSPTVESCPQP